MSTPSPGVSPRPGWLGPLRFPQRLTEPWLAGFRALADWLGFGGRWLGVGLALGILPVLFDWATHLGVSRLITAAIGLPLLLAAVSRDRFHPALTCLCLAVVGHSGAFIALAALDPDCLPHVFPPGLGYWEETHHWLVTGESKAYDVGVWLPSHLQLAVVMVLWCYVSLGFVPLMQGLYELDLMNVYVGRLLASSEPGIGLIFAWHPWSLCRGVGFLFLVYELTSLSLSRLTGERLSSARWRWRRWQLAVLFLCLDAVGKFYLTEPVRRVLLARLVQ